MVWEPRGKLPLLKATKKMTMKLKTALLAMLASAMLALGNYSAPPNGPCDSPFVGGHTGAPGETSCTGCHGGTSNTGPGSLQLALNDTTLRYSPGEIFDARVTMRQTGRDKFGFVALALKDVGNTTIGTFSIDDPTRTRTFSDGPRKYVSHTPCGADAVPPDSLSWTFHWKAPTTNAGNITLYLAGLSANHNHALSGDDTYTLVVHLLPDSMASSLQGPAIHGPMQLWPNPATSLLNFSLSGDSNTQSAVQAEIWSSTGRLYRLENLQQNALNVTNFEAGVYFVRLIDVAGAVIGQGTFVKI